MRPREPEPEPERGSTSTSKTTGFPSAQFKLSAAVFSFGPNKLGMRMSEVGWDGLRISRLPAIGLDGQCDTYSLI